MEPIIKDSNVTIHITDIEKSIAFYQSIGFALKTRWGNHYAQLSAPGIVIGLHPSSENTKVRSCHISLGFTVEDFQEAKIALNKLGILFSERREEGGVFLHFEDPDGTPIYFIQPKF